MDDPQDLIKQARTRAAAFGRGYNSELLLEMADALEKTVDTLEWLVDLQNGPPLPSYEDDWNRAMERARRILGRECRR